jgi:hypothetical protein
MLSPTNRAEPRKAAIIMVCVLLAACEPGMTNDEIIAEANKCTAAGLVPLAMKLRWDDQTRRIECRLQDNP